MFSDEDKAGEREYQVYLLRLWQERPARAGRPPVWRFSLEDPAAHERRGFVNLQALTAFLQTRITETAAPGRRSAGEK